MMIIIYAGKVVTCSAILFGYYFFFLCNKKFHQYNRYYLLACAAFSFLFPLLHLPAFYRNSTTGGTFIKTLSVISSANWEDEIILVAHRNTISSLLTLQNTALAIYATGCMLGGYYIAASLLHIRKLSKIYRKESLETIALYNTQEPGTPFSFFRSLFWNEKIALTSEKGQQILRHELYHISAGHSYDNIFMNCVTTLCWFNPFFHLCSRELKAIHEFLADEHASSSVNKYDYAELLVTEAINNKSSLITNQFFHHQIKRRIAMLIQNRPSNFTYFRRIMALPLLCISFCAFAFKNRASQTFSSYFNPGLNESITVVIDAGHGGIDPGAKSINGSNEKDITLSIAKVIKELSGKYNINVILTRDGDALPGNTSDVNESLKNRIEILQNSKAAIFISIHINSTPGVVYKPGMTNGFEIYISNKNSQYEKSKLLGSAISSEIKNTYKIDDVLKERTLKSIFVLDKSTTPSVMILCGYLTNLKDLDFISKKENQEKIADDILRGIVNYQRNTKEVSRSTPLKINTTDTMPALEFVTLMQNYKKGDKINVYVRMDTATDVMVVKFKDAHDSIVTRLSEVMQYRTKYMIDQFAGNNTTVNQSEPAPQYPGGQSTWITYLNKNLHYPAEAIRNEIQGTVLVQFAVNEAGKVSNVKAVSGPKVGGLREEAIRLIQNSGSWIPPVQNGHPIAANKKQPFVFRLAE